ncbi:hypothetical protein RCL1_001123 [Eukaryota sp. TZLM3-RCL]
MDSSIIEIGSLLLNDERHIEFSVGCSLDDLLSLITSEDLEIVALRDCLWLMAKLSQTHLSLFYDNGRQILDVLLDIVDDTDDSECQRHALRCISSFTYDEELSKHFHEPDRLQVLLNLLGSRQDDVVHLSLQALCNICIDDYCKGIVRECGGLTPIIRCLNSVDRRIVHDSLRTLCNLSLADENKRAIAVSNGLVKIVNCLKDADFPIVRTALAALINLCTDEHNDKILRKYDVVPLVAELAHPNDDDDDTEDTQKFAFRALCNLSSIPKNVPIISSNGVVQLACSNLMCQDVELVSYCLATLTHLAIFKENAQLIRECGGYTDVEILCKHDSQNLSKYAQGCLTVLNRSLDPNYEEINVPISDTEEESESSFDANVPEDVDEVSQLKRQIEELLQREEIGLQRVAMLEDELAKQFEAAKAETQSFTQVQKELEAQTESLRLQLSEAALSLDMANQNEASLQHKLESLKLEHSSNSNVNTSSIESDRISQLEQELASTRIFVNELERKNESINLELITTSQELSNTKAKLSEEISNIKSSHLLEITELERKQSSELEAVRTLYEEKVRDLKNVIGELSHLEAQGVEKVAMLQSDLSAHVKIIQNDNQALLLAQKDLETTRHQYKELQSQADDLRRQLTDASLRLQNAKSKEADLLSRISRLSSDLQAARKDGSETAEELAKRESKLVELEAELTATKDSVVILQQEDDSLQSTLVARESELSTLKSQLENAIAKVHVQRMAEVAELERKQNAELETIRNSYESKIKDLRSTVEELAQREAEGVQKVSLLESELLRQLEANKHDNQVLLLAQKDLETTRHHYKEVLSQANDLRRQLTDASLRLQNAKSKEADLLSRISRLSSDLQAARKDGSETAEELAKRESKLVELEAELTATKDSVVILQQEDDSLQSTLVARESELSTLKSQLENAIAKVHVQRMAEVAELERKQNAELETIRNSYESKIKDLRSTVEELAQREAEGVQKVSLLESELLRQLEANKHDNQALLLAQKDLETTRHQYKELQSQADDLRRQLTDASLRLQNAKSKEADLLSRISRLSGDLQAARKDGSETAEELAKRESKLVELEAELTATKDSVVIFTTRR